MPETNPPAAVEVDRDQQERDRKARVLAALRAGIARLEAKRRRGGGR